MAQEGMSSGATKRHVFSRHKRTRLLAPQRGHVFLCCKKTYMSFVAQEDMSSRGLWVLLAVGFVGCRFCGLWAAGLGDTAIRYRTGGRWACINMCAAEHEH